MAQKVAVALEDDVDGGPADETLRFGFQGAAFEIDLSGKNACAFRKQMAPFIEHARQTGRGSAGRAARTAAGRRRGGDVLAWAKRDALQQKLDGIESVVVSTGKYAEHVKAADRAQKDWRSAAELSKLNSKFTDLAVGAAADDIHLREVQDMSAAADVFRQSITEANLAAKSLFLPDTAFEREG